jgi:3-hydroxyacyl-CoA dehydrogenase
LSQSSDPASRGTGDDHISFAVLESRKIEGLPSDVVARSIGRAGIIGAGTMGSGIALTFANAGIPVTLLDANDAGLAKGLAMVDGILEGMVKRGRIDTAEKARRRGLIGGSSSCSDLAAADVIIEAVFESVDLKKQVFREMEAVAKPGALLATNTSTLDIDEIAAAVKRPEDVLGLHSFSPAHVMPLLEVVRARATSEVAVRTAMELAQT